MMLLPAFDSPKTRPDPTRLPAARLVPAPIGARRLARALALMFGLTMVALLITPWQQNVSGSGEVIAFAPADRQQRIQAPVKGRIVQWFVREGQQVKAGEALAELQDNDPSFFDRLRQQRATVESQLSVYEAQVEQLGGYVDALAEARDRAVDQARSEVKAAEAKVRSAEQKRTAAEAAQETASINLDRTESLFERGLVSKRKLELAQLKATKTDTELGQAEANLREAMNGLAAKRSALANKRAEAEAKVENARASRGKAQASVQDAKNKLLDVDVKLARQSTQLVTAPIDAYVLSVEKAPGQEQIKAGDVLAILVPDVQDRVAAVLVDGNDAAIISKDRHVRLQFEGWPAVQFAGWPSVAVGTFAGVVSFVDAAGDEKGDFRVIVRPDPDGDPWPEGRFLRQGTRVKAWILLDQVALGYELWRRFNGFPPAVKVETKKKDAKSPGAKAGKGHGK